VAGETRRTAASGIGQRCSPAPAASTNSWLRVLPVVSDPVSISPAPTCSSARARAGTLRSDAGGAGGFDLPVSPRNPGQKSPRSWQSAACTGTCARSRGPRRSSVGWAVQAIRELRNSFAGMSAGHSALRVPAKRCSSASTARTVGWYLHEAIIDDGFWARARRSRRPQQTLGGLIRLRCRRTNPPISSGGPGVLAS